MKKSSLASFIWKNIKEQKLQFILIQICCLAWTVDHILWPLWNMKLIDSLTSHMDDRGDIFTVLTPLLIAGVILWLTVEAGFRTGGFLMAKALPKMEASIRMSLFDYVQKHSYHYFSNNFTGSLANKINDLPPSLSRMIHLIMPLFVPVAFAILVGIVLFTWVQPLFGAIMTLWICIHLGISFYYARRCDQLSHYHAEARSKLAGKIVDSLSNYLNAKLFARYQYEREYIEKYQKEELKLHERSQWFMEMVKIPLGIAGFLIPGVGMVGLAIYYWQQSMITNGEVIFILNATSNITIMAWIAGLELPNFYKEIGVCKQALTLVEEPHGIKDAPDAKPLIVSKGEIVFDQVTFHYTPGHALFKDKSLTIHSGEKVGLVGFSGSGKTSFINLILRHYDVESGRILIDGQDISKVTLDSLRRAIAMIPQEPVLFHRSLLENIQYGNLYATKEEVMEAAKRAHCDEFISKLPEGYDTLVGERGLKLSGGQRQRIAIARAILKNAPILILDEATSALDSLTERLIQEGLQDLVHGRTAIVIAHRLSTIAHMDRILVFENGEVLEEGSHEELLLQNGRYAEMWQMQAGGFLPPEEDLYEEMTGEYNLDEPVTPQV
jgi:ATP-binding cassette subfamily B protein